MKTLVIVAGLTLALSASAPAGVKFPEFRADGAGAAKEVMVLGADGRGETGKFAVSRVMNAKVFGQMDEADQKFVDHAASATLAIEGETLSVVFTCPVPPGMTAKKVHEPWNGDRVMFTVHPQIGGRESCCFAANCGGPSSAHGFVNGTRNMGWSSKSKIAVDNRPDGFTVTMKIPVRDAFGKIPEPGDAFGVNFQRLGPTCGNHSAWATEGGAFNLGSSRYGTLVFGGTEPYFKRRLADWSARVQAQAEADPEARELIAKAFAPVEKGIAAHAGDVRSFAALERLFRELDEALVAIALRKSPILLYDNVDVWGDDVRPTADSKMLSEIVFKAPRNTRRVKAFVLANLTDGDYLGNMKVLDNPKRLYWRHSSRDRTPPPPGIQDRFTIRRSVWMHRKNGTPCADPLVELPFHSLVEMGGGKAHAFYLEFDTHGMKPGEYSTTLALVTATAGVPTINVPIKVSITDDDLDTVFVRHGAATHLGDTCRVGNRPAINCLRMLVSRGYNTVLLSRFDGLYPYQDRNGVWQTPDYTEIDRYIDVWIAAGLAKEKMLVKPFVAVERTKGNVWKGLRGPDGKRIPFGTPEYDVGARKLVTDFMAHMKERYGLRKDQVIWYPVDEPNGEFDDPAFKSSISRGVHFAKLIKSIDRDYLTYFDPLVVLCNTKEFQKRAAELANWFDFIEIYRPKISREAVRAVQKAPYRAKWTYHIHNYESSALSYRSGAWLNLRDGFEPESSFWHIDESAAFSGRAGHGYGSCYVDRDFDCLALSRRQLANDMSFEEGRLVKYLRAKFAGDAAKLKAIETIVKDAADHPDMKAFDTALEQLLGLL